MGNRALELVGTDSSVNIGAKDSLVVGANASATVGAHASMVIGAQASMVLAARATLTLGPHIENHNSHIHVAPLEYLQNFIEEHESEVSMNAAIFQVVRDDLIIFM